MLVTERVIRSYGRNGRTVHETRSSYPYYYIVLTG